MSFKALRRIFVVLMALFIASAAVLWIVVLNQQSTITDQQRDTQAQQRTIKRQQERIADLAHANRRLAKRIDRRLDETRKALCNFTADLQNRVHQTEKFLRHPAQFPGFDDPKTVALISQQLQGQKATLDSLSGLNCKNQ